MCFTRPERYIEGCPRNIYLASITCYCVAAKVKVADLTCLALPEIAAAAASRRPSPDTSRRNAPGVPASRSYSTQIRFRGVFGFCSVISDDAILVE